MTPHSLSLRAFVHRFVVALVLCSVVTVSLLIVAFRVSDAKIAQIRTVPIDPALLKSGPNFLIIGSDTRAFVHSQADAAAFGTESNASGQRSDTIMVAHIDPGGRTGLLVSFPRDLWVTIPGHGSSKINAAFAWGGPSLTIATIEQDFGVPISHYLEVDFAGFRNIVNAIGTVPIYFPTPARDTKSGLLVATPGCHRLNGDEALAYVRSRYYEYRAHGVWQYDPTSDIGRIHRQQYFMRSLAQAAAHSVLDHPFGVGKVIDQTVASLSRDRKLGASSLRGLIRAFKNTAPNAFPMFTLPAAPAYRDSQSVLILDDTQAAPALARLRSTKGPKPVPKIAPSSVRVSVENGSGVTGAAGRALAGLKSRGFATVGAATDAGRSDYSVTEVRYGSGAQTKAQLVLAYLGGAGKLVANGGGPGAADVVVILGRDFQQVASPAGSTPPSSSASTAGRSRAHGTTTTTGPPANPGGSMPFAGC